MILNKEQVRALAALARLGVTEEEIGILTPALNRTIQYIEGLREAPIPDGNPTIYGEERRAIGREDRIRPSWPQDDVLRNAPQQVDGCIQTPLVLEN